MTLETARKAAKIVEKMVSLEVTLAALIHCQEESKYINTPDVEFGFRLMDGGKFHEVPNEEVNNALLNHAVDEVKKELANLGKTLESL